MLNYKSLRQSLPLSQKQPEKKSSHCVENIELSQIQIRLHHQPCVISGIAVLSLTVSNRANSHLSQPQSH